MKKFATALAAVTAAALMTACAPAGNAPATNPPAANQGGEYTQVERLARPAINEGLIVTNELLNTWNMVPPSADTTPAAKPLADEATFVLKALGNTDEQVQALFSALLPDVMRIDTTRTSGYAGTPENPLGNVEPTTGRPIGGRMIKDDVIDVTLALIVPGGFPGGAPIANLESDNVSYTMNAQGRPHKEPLGEFPYLADPN